MALTIDAPPAPSSAPTPAPAVGEGGAPAPGDRRRWARPHPGLVAVTVVSFALNAWALTLNGLGNQYYAAATRSMTVSWGNFFYASLDPGGFISVDKPPVALWIAALSARVFGVNTWSLLLPSAVAGAAAVALLWCIIRPRFGATAATVAGAVLALSPVNVAVNRLNLPEPFLILFLIAAAWAALRAVDDERHWGRWVVLSGAFVGLAFNTKMLAAYIPGPALALALVVGVAGLGAAAWWERLKRLAALAASTLVCSVPWIVAVDLLSPSASRPYVGGSTDNTVTDLVFGYNGLGRVNGNGAPGGGGGPGGAMGGVGGVFGGSAGPWRLFSDAVGGQVAWLLPLAVVAAGAGLWLWRQDRVRRAHVALWAGWLALFAVVFSTAEGTFHSYYTAALVPGLAALIGIGAAAVVPLVRQSRLWLAVLAGAAAATLSLQLALAGRVPDFYGWTRAVIVLLAAGALGAVAYGFATRRGRTVLAGLGIGLSALLVAPTAWAVGETANPVLNSTLPQAGPRTGTAGQTFGSASSNGDPELAAFLEANHTTETWDLVVGSAQTASGLIADQGVSVMALGGFMGTDPAITLDQFADLVDAGAVRYVLVSGGGPGGGVAGGQAGPGGQQGGGGPGGAVGGPGGGGGAAATILSAVGQACTPVTVDSTGGALPDAYDGAVYDCQGRADALRSLA